MKLLFVVPSVPWRLRAGYEIITYHHIRYLAQRHSVDVLAFASNSGELDAQELSSYCHRIDTVPIKRWQFLLRKYWGLLTGRSTVVAGFWSSEMFRRLRQCLARSAYDVVIFQTTMMAQYLLDSFQGPSILNMVDPLVLNFQRSLDWKPWFVRPWVRHKIARLMRYELQQARRFSRVLLVNEADIHDYHRLISGARFAWVPHVIDGDQMRPGLMQRRPRTIVISGAMDYWANIDAVEYFCRDIFPRIRREMPSVRLTIVGSRPAASVRKWARDPHIEVTGSVPDIRPYLGEAIVSVCPIRLRVGTQTKILEALAMGTPVVTTSAGNYGVGGVSGEHLYVADDPVEFGDRVLGLLRREHWDRMSMSGRSFVIAKFECNLSGAKLERILDMVVREMRLNRQAP